MKRVIQIVCVCTSAAIWHIWRSYFISLHCLLFCCFNPFEPLVLCLIVPPCPQVHPLASKSKTQQTLTVFTLITWKLYNIINTVTIFFQTPFVLYWVYDNNFHKKQREITFNILSGQRPDIYYIVAVKGIFIFTVRIKEVSKHKCRVKST